MGRTQLSYGNVVGGTVALEDSPWGCLPDTHWVRQLEVAISAPVANTVMLGVVCHGLQRCAN